MPEPGPTNGAMRISSSRLDAGAERPLPDEEIIARVLDGDRACFELLMRRYNRRLFRTVRGIIADDAEAEDVVQDSYVRAYEHLDQFEGRAQFSTWLISIAVREAMARQRRRRRAPMSDDRLEREAAPAPPAGEDEASVQELRSVLTGAVDALPAELRSVFMLRAVEGLDTRETAECLELTEGNVKVRLHRARAMLQGWVDERLGAEVRRLYQFDGERCDRIVTSVLERLSR